MTDRASVAGWYDDVQLVRSLPLYMRLYAAYSRLVANRSTGLVRGGSFLFRLVRRVVPALRLPTEARAIVGDRAAWVDLTDQRVLWVFDELRGTGPEHQALRALLGPGDTFLDVGANHGTYALFAAPIVGAAGLVVAIEPQPRLARLVERSLQDLGVAPFRVLSVAVGERDGVIPLHVPHAASGSASRFRAFLGGRAHRVIDVPLMRMDDVPGWRTFPGALMLKLDTEGSELAFLDGAEQVIRTRHPVILLELNPAAAEAAGGSATAVVRRLEALGYHRFAEIDTYPVWVSADRLPVKRQRNVLALPDDR